MAKRTILTIETESLLVVRGNVSPRSWCAQCAAETEMIGLGNLGVVTNLDRSAIEEWLSSGDLHRSAASDGSPVVCLNSLLAHVGKSNF
ncbi:MAG: hypothetical protein ROO76_20855 [Terriglobia bacterium]|nr:hypothetical protein [Terriglobia bacterium]